ncbi:MAG: hypothetical protein ACK4NM_18550, partial [Hydrogenophaga sp.]
MTQLYKQQPLTRALAPADPHPHIAHPEPVRYPDLEAATRDSAEACLFTAAERNQRVRTAQAVKDGGLPPLTRVSLLLSERLQVANAMNDAAAAREIGRAIAFVCGTQHA